jgi:L-asparaginase
MRAIHLGISLVLLCLSVMAPPMASAQSLKRVTIIGTGGTIAGKKDEMDQLGYKSGAMSVSAILESVQGLNKIAKIDHEQLVNIASQNMTSDVWLALAKRVNELANSATTDAIVITHGTDTLEETAYFLSLVTKTFKPVVMVGAMRAASAVSADGPGNLLDAVAVAVSEDAPGRGVVAVLNGRIDYARNVVKTHTTDLHGFQSPNRGPAGSVHGGAVSWYASSEKRHGPASAFSIEGLTSLPRVDILYAHADMSADLLDAAVTNGAKGLVIAGVGNGNMSEKATTRAASAAEAGIAVLRSTRVGSGTVYRNIEINDKEYMFAVAGDLNPAKSRVLLMLALTRTNDIVEIQKIFDEY